MQRILQNRLFNDLKIFHYRSTQRLNSHLKVNGYFYIIKINQLNMYREHDRQWTCKVTARRVRVRVTIVAAETQTNLFFGSSKLSHKRHDFWRKVIKHKMYVFILCTTSVWNISDSRKNPANTVWSKSIFTPDVLYYNRQVHRLFDHPVLSYTYRDLCVEYSSFLSDFNQN